MKKNNCYTLIIIILFLIFILKVNGQIFLINENYGINVYSKKYTDTFKIDIIKNYPGHTMRLYSENFADTARFELIDKNGNLRIKGQFASRKDTLVKYSLSKELGFTNGKIRTGVIIIKYFYLLEIGKWLYFDDKMNITKSVEYDFKIYNSKN